MNKKNVTVIALTVFLLFVFFSLSWLAYPRMVWWMKKVVEDENRWAIECVFGVLQPHQIITSVAIAFSALFIGLGTYMIGKKRNLKEMVIGWFVLIDVAVVVMIGWLAFLKFRFMKVVASANEAKTLEESFFSVSQFTFFELGIAASVAVLLVAWMYPKKPGE